MSLEFFDGLAALRFGHENERERWGEAGGPFEEWFRSQSSLAAEGRDRLIAWKRGAPFDLDHVFVKTLDTGRLLPLDDATFEIQAFAHPTTWTRGKKSSADFTREESHVLHLFTSSTDMVRENHLDE